MSPKFGRELEYVTADTSQTFKVKWSKVNVTGSVVKGTA